MYHCGLVLEGGGARGIFTAGVLDAFLDEGIAFPYVIGVSAGSCNGVSFLGKNKGRYHDIIIHYFNDKRYMSAKNILRHGEYINSEWVYGELTYQLCPLNHEAYENSGAVFCCPAVNAKTGKTEYFYPKSFRDGCAEVQASCSMPLVTKGTEIGGQLYFDGGVTDSIPLLRAFDDGCERAVVILTQHKGYVKKPVSPQIGKLLRHYPLLAQALLNRHIAYAQQLDYVAQAEQNGSALVIRPAAPLHCSSLEKDTAKLEAIYRLGYKQGQEATEKVKAFLNS